MTGDSDQLALFVLTLLLKSVIDLGHRV